MISLQTMHTLLSALKGDTRVVLLGDAAQLASIDAGLVFSDLCAAAEKCDSGVLTGVVSTLTFNFRARSAPDLIALADHLRSGHLPEETAAAQTPPQKDFAGTFPEFIENFRQISRLCKENTPISRLEAFRLLDEFKIILKKNSLKATPQIRYSRYQCRRACGSGAE